jgi:uncharacterized protein YaiI (UPF0178 family)
VSLMDIHFVQQIVYFVFSVNGEYYRVSFEREEKETDWSVRLLEVNRNQTIYSQPLDAVVTPDVPLAAEIVRTYMQRSKRGI